MWSNSSAGLPMSAWDRSTSPPSSVCASTPSTRESSPSSSTAAIQSRRSLSGIVLLLDPRSSRRAVKRSRPSPRLLDLSTSRQFSQHLLRRDRQVSNSYPARVKHRVADRRRDHGRAALAEPVHLPIAFEQSDPQVARQVLHTRDNVVRQGSVLDLAAEAPDFFEQ